MFVTYEIRPIKFVFFFSPRESKEVIQFFSQSILFWISYKEFKKLLFIFSRK